MAFSELNPLVTLRKHQKDAAARIVYGGNCLIGHAVGGGKTFTYIAGVKEKLRLGLCRKAMIVVPNNIVADAAKAVIDLCPDTRLLMATEKDFKKESRRRYIARIATGNNEMVILSYEQFSMIPMSREREMAAYGKAEKTQGAAKGQHALF